MILRSNRARWVVSMGVTAVIFLLIPWPRKIRVAAELRPSQEFHLVAPESAELVELPLPDGAEVTAGAPLAALRSRLLEFNVAQARLRSERARTELAAVSVDPAQQSRLGVAQSVFATAEAELKTREDALEQLRPRAPFDGVIRWYNAPIVGENLARNERYATLAGNGPNRAVAYVDEEMLLAISSGAAVRFYPEACPERSFPLRVTIIETDAARILTHPLLAIAHGGTVSARLVDQEWLPAVSTYRILMQAEGPDASGAPQVQRGLAVIDGGWGSWGRIAWRRAVSVIWREFGF
jgi:multidrug resistance efflux pump